MTVSITTSLKMTDVVQIRCDSSAAIPNNPRLPAVIYPQVVIAGTEAERITAHYERNNWTRTWVYTLFDFHHYHYAAHEVLAVISGSAVLQLGGDEGPCRAVSEGDVAILPAGYGHKLVESDGSFTVVGGYPAGQDDIGFNRAGEDAARGAVVSIAATTLPDCDPIFGAAGPLMDLWCKLPN